MTTSQHPHDPFASREAQVSSISGSLDLSSPHSPVTVVRTLEQHLHGVLLERDEAIHAALLALVAREHLLLVGPPGTAKSLLVNLLARAIADAHGQPLPTFSYLMSRFTTLDDLFGPISLPQLKLERHVRVTRGRLAEVKLAFLDEVLRGSDPSLEALLTLMNERQFDNDGRRIDVPLLSLFGATNTANLPQNPDGKIGAVWDRFLLRVPVAYVQPNNFIALLQQSQTPATQLQGCATEEDVVHLQQWRSTVSIPTDIYQLLAQIRVALLEKKVVVSDRRWQKSVAVIQAQALLSGRTQVQLEDLKTLRLTLWQKPEQIGEIARLLIGLVSPFESEILEVRDQAESVVSAHTEAQNNASLSEEERMKASMEALAKLKGGIKRLERLRGQMRDQGLALTPLEEAVALHQTSMLSIQECIVSGV
jgi:MoxR-like ATPase